ncbi:MAG: hypothetical protein FJ291_05495 [Planctomycetes bacterium]|nr:hypothetical protein [Planctomycetota bacterium]
MRKLAMAVVAVVFGAGALLAGEGAAPEGGQKGRPGGRQRGPGGGFRGGPMMGPGGMTMGRANQETDIFDVARRTAKLADDKLAAIEGLAIEYAVAEQEAEAEARKRLNKEYLPKLVALLPEAERPGYEKAVAAMTQRDDAIAAAEKELRAVLDKVKVAQGADKVKPADDTTGGPRFFQPRRGEVATRKMDALRTCFVLTDDQRKQLDTIADANRNAVREKMRGQFANLRPQGGGRPDPAQMRQAGTLFRQARTEADEANAKAAVNLLNDAQKKDFATACSAIDAYNKKVADAEAACRKAVTDAIGAEKAGALLGTTPGGAPPAPGATF